MARNCDDNDDKRNDHSSITAVHVKSSSKPELMKELLHSSFQDNTRRLGSDALSLVVEAAQCLVSETCLRASTQALNREHDQCLPTLMLDFP